jgi:hypothetical protein
MKGMNHLFFRMCYLFIAWIVVLKPVIVTNDINKTAIFSTLFLFLTPLLIDYWGFNPATKQGVYLQLIGGFLTSFAIIFALVGVFNGIPLDQEKGTTIFNMPIKYIWYFSGIWIVLALADWIISITPKEVKAQQEARRILRKSEYLAVRENMKKRTTYYKRRERGMTYE